METGLARPPLPSYTAISPVERAPQRTEPSARTELSEGRAVNPSEETETARRTAENASESETRQAESRIERRNFVDLDSNTLIFQATDSETGEVIRQIPSETLRRLRAYAETIANQETNANQQLADSQDQTVQRSVEA